MSKKKPAARAESGSGKPAEGGRVSPEATGIDPDVGLLGPEEIRGLFAKAVERDAIVAERDDMKTRWMRAQADLDNFRRREAQELRRAADEEADRVLEPVLDAFDTFSRAVDASEKSKDSAAVMAKMKELPTDDPLFGKGSVRADGRKMHDMYLFEVKKPGESKGPWDYYKQISVLPAEQAFRPIGEGNCPLVRA